LERLRIPVEENAELALLSFGFVLRDVGRAVTDPFSAAAPA
jgi:hypothetical protein